MRKIFFVWCATLWLSASLPALNLSEIKSTDELFALQGGAFYKAAEMMSYDGIIKLPLTVTERFKILDRMIQEKVLEHEQYYWTFVVFTEDFGGRLETKDELLALRSRLEKISTHSDAQSSLAEILLDLRCRLLLAEWREHPPLKVSAKSSWPWLMDSRLKKYPAERQRDWRLYRSLSAPFAKLVDRAERQRRQPSGSVSFLANKGKFWQLVTDLATDRQGNTAEDVLRYEWDNWCGTGSGKFSASQSKALSVALLKEQRGAEAVGALLMEYAEAYDDSSSRRKQNFVQRAEFLTLLADGWDWRQLAFGGLLAAEIGKDEWNNHHLRRNCLLLLTASGGEREARQLLELSRSAPAAVLPEYLAALKKLTTPKKNSSVTPATREEIAQFIRSQKSR